MEYYHFFVDVWRLFKKYKSIAVNSEEYFEAMVEATGKLAEKYQYRQLAVDITVAVCKELERIARRKSQSEQDN